MALSRAQVDAPSIAAMLGSPALPHEVTGVTPLQTQPHIENNGHHPLHDMEIVAGDSEICIEVCCVTG